MVDGDKDRSRVSVSGIKVPINGYTRDTACLKPRPPTTGTHRRPLVARFAVNARAQRGRGLRRAYTDDKQPAPYKACTNLSAWLTMIYERTLV